MMSSFGFRQWAFRPYSGTQRACGEEERKQKGRELYSILLGRMAGTTGLEPAASAVTGQRSNQLNYVPKLVFLPLSETRVFSGFPQVQSIRLCRLLQPRRTEFRG
jgi:hypothetical protein